MFAIGIANALGAPGPQRDPADARSPRGPPGRGRAAVGADEPVAGRSGPPIGALIYAQLRRGAGVRDQRAHVSVRGRRACSGRTYPRRTDARVDGTRPRPAALGRAHRPARSAAVARDPAHAVHVLVLLARVRRPHAGDRRRRTSASDPKSSQYGVLYACFGLGAALGAISGRHGVRAAVEGEAAAARRSSRSRSCSRCSPCCASRRSRIRSRCVLGYVYFVVITVAVDRLIQIEPRRTKNAGRVMALWIMGFGGTVPLGVLVGGLGRATRPRSPRCCSPARCGRSCSRCGRMRSIAAQRREHSMSERASRRRTAELRARRQRGRRAADRRRDARARSSPATPEWRVRDVLAHLVGVTDDVVERPARRRRDRPVDRGAGRRASGRVDRRRCSPSGTTTGPQFEGDARGAAPARSPARRVFDAVTHEADIRHALGAPGVNAPAMRSRSRSSSAAAAAPPGAARHCGSSPSAARRSPEPANRSRRVETTRVRVHPRVVRAGGARRRSPPTTGKVRSIPRSCSSRRSSRCARSARRVGAVFVQSTRRVLDSARTGRARCARRGVLANVPQWHCSSEMWGARSWTSESANRWGWSGSSRSAREKPASSFTVGTTGCPGWGSEVGWNTITVQIDGVPRGAGLSGRPRLHRGSSSTPGTTPSTNSSGRVTALRSEWIKLETGDAVMIAFEPRASACRSGGASQPGTSGRSGSSGRSRAFVGNARSTPTTLRPNTSRS